MTSMRAGESPAACLASLSRQECAEPAGIIVAASPEALTKAMLETHTGVVAVIDARCECPPDWLRKLASAHRSGIGVIGGAVSHGGPGTIAAWAAYYADYGPFAPPEARREVRLLAGNHVSYKRRILEQHRAVLHQGYRKTFFHRELELRGEPMLFDPDLVLSCRQPDGVLAFALRYYREARAFALARAALMTLPARLIHFAGTPALPLVLLYRRVAAVWPKRAHRLRLLACAPWLALFVVAWSAGEAAGFGRSCISRP